MANSTGEGKGLSDRALTALLEDIQADCTAEQIQAIWQRAVYLKMNAWQALADLFNAHRPLAAKPADSALRLKLAQLVEKWRSESWQRYQRREAEACADELSTLLTEDSK